MPGFDGYLKRRLAEKIANTKGESLSEIIDRLNKFEEKPLKFVDLESDIANLKKKITSQEPLFTLAAEEVEIVSENLDFLLTLHDLGKTRINDQDYTNIDNLLTRIKQWQDDNSEK